MEQKKAKTEFVSLLTPNYYKIHCFILSLVANRADSEDILQTTITYMWEHYEEFEPGTNFLAWAFTIARYNVMSYRKKHMRSIVSFSDQALQVIQSECERSVDEIDVRFDYLRSCIKKLNSRDTELVKKRFENNVAVKNIADELNTSANVVYKRIAKIKDLLLKCVNKSAARGEFA